MGLFSKKPLCPTALVCELRTPLPEIIMGVCWVEETHSITAAAISMVSALLPTDTGCSIKPEGLLLLLVTQSRPALCYSMDCSPPGSSIHGILQARILEWVAVPFSRGSSQPRDWTQVSHTAGRFFTICTTGEGLSSGLPVLPLATVSWRTILFPEEMVNLWPPCLGCPLS